MKRVCLFLAASFLTTACYADAADQSATLNITASIGYGATAACKVEAAMPNILLFDILGKQGENADQGIKTTVLKVVGVRDRADCYEAISSGHIALTLSGMADDVEGTVLANTYPQEDKAQGVGIGLYQFSTGKPIKINSDYLHFDAPGSLDATLGLEMVKLKGKIVKSGNVSGSLTVGIQHL
ncbi:type 1 fimbrial protein [Enterobacter cloacae complex sp. P6RS]|uniref:fimbrial protein n=1 Tax=unclassified Enterobacter cloacae complex TaxID=2757714 RepID=UPI001875AB16|nr:type 1 fimbrial protein [Enterobacter cloacae complex sp. P4RS]MBE4994530.1 type 1 fimbrial protein [Enterobacter cloacae complex sp. P6RS]